MSNTDNLKSSQQKLKTSPSFLSKENREGGMPVRHHSLALVCHVYYPELIEELVAQCALLENNFDIYLSISKENLDLIPIIFKYYPNAYIYLTENVGRDINPFIVILKAIQHLGYETLLKLHTKQSPHRSDGKHWRQDIIGKLLGTKENIASIREKFAQDPQVGLIAPRGHVISYSAYCGASRDRVLGLAQSTGLDYSDEHDFPFAAGTMFWANPKALERLTRISEDELKYEKEPLTEDGALVHAIERFIGLAVVSDGFTILDVDGKGNLGKPDLKQDYPYTPSSKQLKLRNIRSIILFSPYDERFAIEHVRITAPYTQAGIQIVNGVVKDEIRFDLISTVDAVVFQREFPRNLTAYRQIRQTAEEHAIPIIYDLDDLLFDLPDDHPERQSMDYADALMPMMTALVNADLVTVATAKLKKILADFNENIQVVPNYLDDALWELSAPSVQDSKDQVVTVGYMGSSSHTPDLEMIAPVLNALLQKYGEKLKLHIWGMPLPDSLVGNPGVEWTASPSNNYRDFASYFQAQSADIFIAPLSDNLFNRCKSGLKFLEYSALGVPGVFSNLDGYSALITNGQDGFLAGSLQDWEQALTRLIEEPGLRAEIARNAQLTLRDKWLLSKNISTWQDVLKSAELSFGNKRQVKMASADLINAISDQVFWLQSAKDELAQHLQESNLALTAKVDSSVAYLDKERQAYQKLEASFQAKTQEVETLSIKAEAQAAEVKSLADRLEEVAVENKRLGEKAEQLNKAIDALNQQREDDAIEKQRLADLLTRQKADDASEKMRLAGLVDQKAQQNQRISAELADRVGELDAIKASKAWKVALFLRKARAQIAPVDGWVSRAIRKMNKSISPTPMKLREKISLKRDVKLIKSSPLFDQEWYLENYPDVMKNGIDPANHYMFFGAFEGRDPSPKFSSSEYLELYPDVTHSGINPLIHYLKFGINEGRPTKKVSAHRVGMDNSEAEDKKSSTQQMDISESVDKIDDLGNNTSNPQGVNHFQAYYDLLKSSEGITSPDFVPLSTGNDLKAENIVKLIAFYLPQFHPFPENDLWWGRGFTEWTNVSKAVPQFIGHHQPRLPGELGYYDLRLYDVQKRQIELARLYGIYGFCFHYYWFNGKRLLEKPLNLFLEHKENKFPFCICWANENWTRRWDGQENDILIAQEHSFENDKRFIADLKPLLADPRYIKIDGKPLIIIYRPSLLKDPQKTTSNWRDYCQQTGLGTPYLVAAQTFGFSDPSTFGFDAAVEFPPHNITYTNIKTSMQMLNSQHTGAIYDYREMVSKNIQPISEKYRVIRTVCPGWDNEPRKPGKGNSFAYASPKMYQRWLEQACYSEILSYPKEERMVFINAWNEWGEGAYLEPDRKFGYAYLQATYEAALNSFKRRFLLSSGEVALKPTKTKDTLVILHVYYTDLFDEITSYLENIPGGFDLIVSLPASEKDFSETIFKKYPEAQIFLTENQGRDIAPFIEIFRSISSLKYKTLLKIHTKKSIHRQDGLAWRHDILDKLLGTADTVQKIKDELSNNGNVGLVAPKDHVLDHRVYWGFNKNKTLKLAKETGIDVVGDPDFVFIAGSMFWANPKALNFLKLLPVSSLDFEPEPTPPDGALAHAIERLIGFAAKANGFCIKEIDAEGNIMDPGEGNAYPYAVPFP